MSFFGTQQVPKKVIGLLSAGRLTSPNKLKFIQVILECLQQFQLLLVSHSLEKNYKIPTGQVHVNARQNHYKGVSSQLQK
jgi:hypothetical protein